MREISKRVVARVEQLLLLVIIVCVATTTAVAASEAAPPIAKPGCQSKCGNVSIPFPFGMGSKDCYLDKWFEIVCNNSSHTPILKLFQLEVLKISGGDSKPLLVVRSPISFMNCGNDKKNSIQSADIKGSHFLFSSARNSFMVMSCGKGTVIDASSNNNIVQIGCSSNCLSSLQNRSRTSYCEITNLPSELNAFKIDFRNSTEDPGQCRYAFVVDQDWFRNLSRNEIVSIPDMDSVPVVLNWYLDLLSYSDKFQPLSDREYYCITSLNTYPKIPGRQRFYCACRGGFQGNAHLTQGCKDFQIRC